MNVARWFAVSHHVASLVWVLLQHLHGGMAADGS